MRLGSRNSFKGLLCLPRRGVRAGYRSRADDVPKRSFAKSWALPPQSSSHKHRRQLDRGTQEGLDQSPRESPVCNANRLEPENTATSLASDIRSVRASQYERSNAVSR